MKYRSFKKLEGARNTEKKIRMAMPNFVISEYISNGETSNFNELKKEVVKNIFNLLTYFDQDE